MKLSAILAPLLDAQADHEMIRRTILAYEAEQTDALARRRETDAKRQADKRGRDKSRDVTLRHSDRRLAGAEGSSSRVDIITKEVSVSPAAQPKRASRLPADWTLPEAWLDEAVAAGMPRQRALSEAERMKNWSLSNKNGAKLDWLAAWRNWYRDKIEQPQAASQAPPSKAPRNAGEFARQELQRMGLNHDATSSQTRHIDQSDGSADFAGNGIARRFAIASSR